MLYALGKLHSQSHVEMIRAQIQSEYVTRWVAGRSQSARSWQPSSPGGESPVRTGRYMSGDRSEPLRLLERTSSCDRSLLGGQGP